MDTLSRLGSGSKIGIWCKRGALLIAIAGTIQILLILYAVWGEYRQMQDNNPAPGDVNYLILIGATQVFTAIITTVFFALILYVIGVVLSTHAAPTESDITFETIEKDEEDIPPDEDMEDMEVART